jgi:5-methylcytosine-specific restriction endonuclease McrA
MKYKDKEIGVPTFEQFSKIVSEVCGKSFSADILYKTLYGRKWKTKNGKPISDLERTLKGMCGSIGKWSYFTKETQERIRESKRRFRENKVKPIINKIVSEKKVPYSPYNEQLQDDKWKSFRRFIFTVRGCKCEMCGATEKLQVHHPNYIKGRKAWEYTCNEVVVLCEQCHRKAHGLNY